MKGKTIATIAAVLLLTVTFAHGQPPQSPCGPFGSGPHGRGMGPGMQMKGGDDDNFFGRGMGCLAGMELTEKQQDQIAKMRLNHHRAMIEMHNDIAGIQGKIKLLITDDNFSTSTLDDLAGKLGKFKTKMIQMRVNHMREIRDLLTAEQKIAFDQMVLSKPGMGAGHGSGKMGCKGGSPHRGMRGF